MSLSIDRDTLLQLVNKFYASYDSAKQFDEAFSLYQSVVSGDRTANDVMNALYETYPSAKTNLQLQVLWRFYPDEFNTAVGSNNNNLFAQAVNPNHNVAGGTFFEQFFEYVNKNVAPIDYDFLPCITANNNIRRVLMQCKEIAFAYSPGMKVTASPGKDFGEPEVETLIQSIQEELASTDPQKQDLIIFDRAKFSDDTRDNFSVSSIKDAEALVLKEVEQYFASKAADDEKQRAALWRTVFDSDIAAIEAVDDQIAACDGNAVQATRLFRERLRNSTVRIESNLLANSRKTIDDAQKSSASSSAIAPAAAAAAVDTSNVNNNLPGAETRSGSAQDKKSIEHLRTVLERGQAALEANEKRLREKEQELAAKEQRTPEDLARFAAIRDELNARERDLFEVQQECQNAAARLNERQLQLEAWEKALTMRESEFAARQQNFANKEEELLIESQKRAEQFQVTAAALLRREQLVEVKEHVLTQRENEVRRKEESLVEKDTQTDRRAEAIVQRSLELERLIAEYELRSLRVKTRENAIWKSYMNQQLANADPSATLTSSNAGASLQTLAKDLKSVRGHLERLGTVSGSFSGSSGGTPERPTTTSAVVAAENNNNNHNAASRGASASSILIGNQSPIPKK